MRVLAEIDTASAGTVRIAPRERALEHFHDERNRRGMLEAMIM
jgi:hypothetical protein